mgnify:CR=1 FL=1
MEVDALLKERAHPLQDVITALRKLIRAADVTLVEEVKWNAPSYRLEEHLLTFQLARDDRVLVVFHRGAKVRAPSKRPPLEDPAELLSWKGTDRATVSFSTRAQVTKHKAAFTKLVRGWLDFARSA